MLHTLAALLAFAHAYAGISSCTYSLHTHEVTGSRMQDRVYSYAFLKPALAKTTIVAGDHRGSAAIWNGGDTLKAHEGGLFSIVHVTMGVRDARATSMLGYTLPDGLLQNIVARFTDVPGTRTQTAAVVDGRLADIVTLHPSNPAAQDHGATRDVIAFSHATALPIRITLYVRNTLLVDESIADLKLNPNLTVADF